MRLNIAGPKVEETDIHRRVDDVLAVDLLNEGVPDACRDPREPDRDTDPD